MKELNTNTKNKPTSIDEEKRDFLFITTTGLAIAGGGAFAWSLIDTMNPSKDVLALSTTEVDLSPLEEGQSLTVQKKSSCRLRFLNLVLFRYKYGWLILSNSICF